MLNGKCVWKMMVWLREHQIWAANYIEWEKLSAFLWLINIVLFIWSLCVCTGFMFLSVGNRTDPHYINNMQENSKFFPTQWLPRAKQIFAFAFIFSGLELQNSNGNYDIFARNIKTQDQAKLEADGCGFHYMCTSFRKTMWTSGGSYDDVLTPPLEETRASRHIKKTAETSSTTLNQQNE